MMTKSRKYEFNVRNNGGLSLETLERNIPSIFAAEAHQSRSARYTYIPTLDILQGMIKEGFIPVQAMQAKPRIQDKMNFAKHLIRLRRKDDLGKYNPESFEIVLVNSHDGSSTYNLMNGVFRMVCENGLISGDVENDYKIQHKGNIIDNVIEAAYTVLGTADQTMEDIQEMKGIELKQEEKLLLAEYSLKARFEDKEEDEIPLQPRHLLRPRRYDDNKNDLFTTMNVIQENALKGGITNFDKDFKRKTTRAINGIDQNIKVNKLIWSFAEELKKIHTK